MLAGLRVFVTPPQLFVALSEQSPHRRALVNVPGLLHSASSYVVSATTTGPPSSCSTSSVDSAEASAFRLLGNLACADGPRRRITELDGLVLAAARALSASALVLAPPAPASASSSAVSVGEAAAALLGQLSPVLGKEGGEEELVAAGEALSVAIAAVSKTTTGGDPPAATADDDGRLEGLASEALSGLLVLSWSDSGSLDAAAAVDGFITDPRLADGVVSLWRRATAAAATTTAPAPPSSSSPGLGTLPYSALAVMSSIACRPTGRQSLVAAGVASAVVDVALRESGGGRGRSGGNGEGCSRPRLTVAERSEIIRLLCVLCASPAHRAAVRSSLVAAAASSPAERETRGISGGGSEGGAEFEGDGDDDAESEDAAVEAAVARIQGGGGDGGGGGSSQDCRAGACRLAFLLGTTPPAAAVPPRRLHHPGGTAAGAGAFAAEHLSSPVPEGSSSGRRVPSRSPPIAVKPRSTSATTHSPSPPPPPVAAPGAGRGAASGGDGGGRWARTAFGYDADVASVDSQELEEALFPTTTAAATQARPGAAPGRSEASQTTPAFPRIPASAPAPSPAAPPTRPAKVRSDSEESLHRVLSMIANAEGGDGSGAAGVAATGVQATMSEERGRVESREAGTAGLYGSGGGGGTLGRSQSDEKTQCKACGKLVYTPSGFDLALIECPHCQQSMG